jgi:iron transport multicopper oxidase
VLVAIRLTNAELMARLALLALSLLISQCLASTVELWFNVTWTTANPDGLFERKVIGINNTWPLPVIEVNKGDRLIVHAHNGLGDKATSIHFHGMFQNGTSEMDGANMISQCPISPGSTFTYNFTINQNGTYCEKPPRSPWKPQHMLSLANIIQGIIAMSIIVILMAIDKL